MSDRIKELEYALNSLLELTIDLELMIQDMRICYISREDMEEKKLFSDEIYQARRALKIM